MDVRRGSQAKLAESAGSLEDPARVESEQQIASGSSRNFGAIRKLVSLIEQIKQTTEELEHARETRATAMPIPPWSRPASE